MESWESAISGYGLELKFDCYSKWFFKLATFEIDQSNHQSWAAYKSQARYRIQSFGAEVALGISVS